MTVQDLFYRTNHFILPVMENSRNLYKFPYIAVALLQFLISCNPASAGEAPDKTYFRLITATCQTCHSDDSRTAVSIPKLDGLTATRIKQLLTSYKSGQEQGTIMNRISKALTDEEIDGISGMFYQTAK